MIDFEPIWLSLKIASITTFIVLVISIPISYWLVFGKFKFKSMVEAMISLPFVLPPSVLGFYLLLAFSPINFFGKFLDQHLNIRLVFTTEGLILASIICSFPFMINPILAGLKNLPLSLQEASFSLGKSKTTTLFRILIPNIKSSILIGIIMTFAHSIGEFGVVLMIGGSIPSETKVVSIAIYDQVQAMNYKNANIYAVILLVFTFFVLLFVHWLNNKTKKSFFVS